MCAEKPAEIYFYIGGIGGIESFWHSPYMDMDEESLDTLFGDALHISSKVD